MLGSISSDTTSNRAGSNKSDELQRMSTPPISVIQISEKSDKLELKSQESKASSKQLSIPRVEKENGDRRCTNEMSKVLMPCSSERTSNNKFGSNKSDAPHEMTATLMHVSPLQPTLRPNLLAQPSASPTPLPNVLSPPSPPLALNLADPSLSRSPPPTTPSYIKVTPPQPPIPQSKESISLPQPSPIPLIKGAAPPPPPPQSVTKVLHLKKENTKLKRSAHMGNLYRLLKGKVEGSSLDGKSSQGRRNQLEGSTGGKQGMADALEEITRRSAYFQQIEEDAQKYATSIIEMKVAINSFQTKDMAELLKFHQYVELHMEDLTDETQVLARFKDFPIKKLETLRAAATLYSRLNAIVANLEGWKVVTPLSQHLGRVECYFNKIKGEVDALERKKDEESKRFQDYGIHFDFHILVRIKELMVDVSSSCIELALEVVHLNTYCMIG
ncbi:PREDICTED: uncharacterized protein At4g04980-like [Nelumbo nucifera]|uniref:Uncharacterized protein At4g04980-like n=1 Tax=Nelumbo nucifera TaxID=4432 RepID=A0A1U8BIA0_NELNU|nr:PREDICTED: uncharacterized protein At4g04980-like [Nelumbo nucifera]